MWPYGLFFFKQKTAYEMRISDWSSDVCSSDLGVSLRVTSGPVIEKAGDLAALLTNLQPHDVLFIDEIHRLSPVVEEVLYPAMEDFQIDIMIGEGPAARSIKLDLPPFTLIGATTRAGLLTRSEEHTSELQSLMRISYAVFCLQKKNTTSR